MKILVRLLLAIHFFIVVITICHLNNYIKNPIILAIINYYSAITYTNRCFGFFAPNVGNDLQVNMIMSNDKYSQEYKMKVKNFEMRTRLYSLGGHFAEGNDESTMDLFARSWAVKCLNEYPDMNKVAIKVYENKIPSMIEFKHGKRITQHIFYSANVEKK